MKLKANLLLNGSISGIYLIAIHWAYANGLEETFVSLAYGFVFVTITANLLYLLFFGNKRQ